MSSSFERSKPTLSGTWEKVIAEEKSSSPCEAGTTAQVMGRHEPNRPFSRMVWQLTVELLGGARS
jgi:hypothetical protein